MPKIDLPDWTEEPDYVEPVTGARLAAYAHRKLGDAAGLTQFGAVIERLPPGAQSSLRHWHEAEDELLYLLEGRLTLIEDRETELVAGDAAGWRAGDPVAHCLENRGDAPAVYLVVGTRAGFDVIHYPDHDLVVTRDGDRRSYARADGTLIKET